MENKILKSEKEIDREIKILGERISKDYSGESVDLISLNQAPKLFTPDLANNLTIDFRIQELEFSNYASRTESGEVKLLKDLDQPIFGRNIILTDGIIISGITHDFLCKLLSQRSPKSIAIASIASKPKLRKKELPICYTLFDFSDEMIEGYGMGTEKFKTIRSLFDVR